ncbi:IS4 family transposase [Laspinema palackyanum]|uniref:IS4 family transposase n=1 Tax=Laspinema palackyanum TaxID=3231601 RepID=UPI00345C9F3A|nr:IS4 family transposase [Laspinema sp. D2c]
MLKTLYQKVLRIHLSESQTQTLELLVLMLQSYRQVRLSTLANIFPQPIQYKSRVKSLQRFLQLPQLSAKLLWFPIIKAALKSEFREKHLNRAQRRKRSKLRFKTKNYVAVALDRTQWRDRNLLMVTIIWGNHALPIYWELLPKLGSSSFREQKRVLGPVLALLKPYPVVVIGDREFHSAKLADWLRVRSIDVVFRQKKSAFVATSCQRGKSLKTQGFKSGESHFFTDVTFQKSEPIQGFNLGVYWEKSHRGKKVKEPWYLLTTISNPKLVKELYQARWGIEMMFRDCKSGGYNMESTRVDSTRFLALVLLITFAYWLATNSGHELKSNHLVPYLGRSEKTPNNFPHHSIFWLGLSGYAWSQSLLFWQEEMLALMALKPHKAQNFRQGLNALSLVQQLV